MSVTEVKITSTRRGQTTQDGRRTTLSYVVLTDDPNDEANVVSLSLPRIGDAYVHGDAIDFGQRCVNVDIRDAEGDNQKWLATVTFASQHGLPGAAERVSIGGSEGPFPIEPAEREPIYGVRFERFQEPVRGDYDEDQPNKLSTDSTGVFVNSIGQPFNPQPTKDSTRSVFIIRETVNSLSPRQLSSLQDIVNEFSFGVFEARTLKLNITDVQPRFEEGKERYDRIYELSHKRDKWDSAVQDEGTIADKEGVVRRTLLRNGTATTATSDISYVTAKPYRLVDFNTSAEIPSRVRDFRNV